ncbi:MAG: hypothetical protein K2Q22_15345 [Cytophagales bacterium]|nr:hypothetical protein [Cytophagales bacterium]
MSNFFENLESNRLSIANWSMAFGSLILFFLASLLLTTATGFFLGIPIGWSQFISSLVMALGLSFDLVNNIKIDGGGKNVGLRLFGYLIVLIVVSLAVETPFYDISFDGQNYHQEGIIQLKEGWNPNIDPLPTGVDEYTRIFTGHFAKGSWYIDASLYAITGFVQSGKASNILYIVASLLFTLALILKITPLKVWQSMILVSILAFNPIWAYQYLSYYVDGQLSACILILIGAFAGLYLKIYNRYMLLFVAGCSIIIMSNLKFTGPVFSAILGLGFCTILAIKSRWKETIQTAILLLIFGVVAIGYAGYGTYVTNVLSHGHPFFPLNKEDILGYQTPANFKESPGVVALFQSVFSESGQIEVEKPSVYKIPLTFTLDELKIFAREEPRTGGFGPLFSGGFVLGAALFLYVFLIEKKRPSLELGLGWITLFVSVIVIPSAWWARYVPHFFLLVLLMGTWAYLSTNTRWVKLSLSAVFVVLFINTWVIKAIYTGNNVAKTLAINDQIRQLEGKTVWVDFGIFQATRMRFVENKIPFVETPRSNFYTVCQSPAQELVSSYGSVKLCIKK